MTTSNFKDFINIATILYILKPSENLKNSLILSKKTRDNYKEINCIINLKSAIFTRSNTQNLNQNL